MATDVEINERFCAGNDAGLPPDVLAELHSIMRIHQLPLEDMYFKWDAYCMKRETDVSNLNLLTVRAFKQDIQDALERNTRTGATARTDTKRVGATPRTAPKKSEGGDWFNTMLPSTPATAIKFHTTSSLKKKAFETPSVSRARTDLMSSSPDFQTTTTTTTTTTLGASMEEPLKSMNALPPSSFNDRANPGEVVLVFNGELEAASVPMAPYPNPRIKLTASSDLKKLAYKPLAMKLSEASEVLDDRIDDFVQLVMDHHSLDPSVFGNPASRSTTPVIAVGRIAIDSPAGGKLNAASVVLETSRRGGDGLRVPLNMGKLPGYSLFPGQIVALKGINSAGIEFVVDEMLDLPLIACPASTAADLETHARRLRGVGLDEANSDPDRRWDNSGDPEPLAVYFASGPYTADDNLDFEPLYELCAKAADEHIDALVLAGPFVDVDHPLVASGDFDLPADADVDPDTATLATLFRHLVSPALARLAGANPSVTIILVPSTRDAIDKHVAWPQDMAGPRRDLGLPKCARLVTNPVTLKLNETVMAVSSQDVLLELRNEELVVGRPADTDLLVRLCRHIVQQRHYFPLFPPTGRERLPRTGTEDGLATGMVMDTSYLKLGEMANTRPDIFFTPSALPPFVKVVDSVLMLNPGYLSRRRGAGTYARMALHSPSLDRPQVVEGMFDHQIFHRARVEIVRI